MTPFTAFFWFFPMVWRASRVASDFSTATALTAAVFVTVFTGAKLNAVSSGLLVPKRLWRNARRRERRVRAAVAAASSVWMAFCWFFFVVAVLLAASR